MAAKEKSQWAQLRVGILGLVALFLVALLVFLLTGSMDWFKKKEELHVFLSDSAGLTTGAPVRINGISAGKVQQVALSGDRNPARVIKVDFKVDADMMNQIPDDSVVSVGSDNLLGSTKFLQIVKGTRPVNIQPNATMKSANTQQFDQLVQQGFGVVNSAQAILVKIQDIVGEIENGQGTIGKLLVDATLYNSLVATVNQVQTLAGTLNTKTGTIGHLINDNELYDRINGIVARVDTLTKGLQDGQGTAGLLLKDPGAYNKLNGDLDQLNKILADLNAGKGSLGLLLKDPKIANQLSTTMDRIDVTLDKVNSGQGTIGQLLVNPQLYDELNGTTRELHGLLQDFRANPKKFLSIKLHIF
jgi:phospholipid/cholesterol/gamma-HCH transport system substrate-binding protein